MSEIFHAVLGQWYSIYADTKEQAELAMEAYVNNQPLPEGTEVSEQPDIDIIWSDRIN